MSALLQLADVGTAQPPDDADFYRTRVADLLKRKVKSFPGAQPVSFSKKHFEELRQQE